MGASEVYALIAGFEELLGSSENFLCIVRKPDIYWSEAWIWGVHFWGSNGLVVLQSCGPTTLSRNLLQRL